MEVEGTRINYFTFEWFQFPMETVCKKSWRDPLKVGNHGGMDFYFLFFAKNRAEIVENSQKVE